MSVFIKQCFCIKTTSVLLCLTVFCLFLSCIRVLLTRDIFLLFLGWNLILAFIPWFISITLYITKLKYKLPVAMLIILWLVFFPNATYILTDIIHLKRGAPQYQWFDFILITAYYFAGLLYAFTSLDLIERVLSSIFVIKYPVIFSVIVLYLSAYGIYLGRFLRWNSWDVVVNMPQLFHDIFLHLIHPVSYARVWAFSALLGTALILFYWAFRVFGLTEHSGTTLH